MAARAIDWMTHFIVILMLIYVFMTIFSDDGAFEVALFFGIASVLRGVFEIGFVGALGATPGKLAMRLRVVAFGPLATQKMDIHGRPAGDRPSWKAAVVRGILIDLPTLFGGFVFVFWEVYPDPSNSTGFLLFTLWGATWVFWFVQIFSIFARSERRGVHDRASATVVVKV